MSRLNNFPSALPMNIFKGPSIILFLCCALTVRSFAADVLTFHNDNAHTGLNSAEITLTPQDVKANSFGLLRNLPVDGAAFAQTLYVSNVQVISGAQSQGVHNLLIVATEHDSVYAFDADSGGLYWKVSLLGAGEVPSDGRGCGDLPGENGVTSPPMIDRMMGPRGTIYVLAMSKTPDGTHYYERLHALDLGTGLNILSPVTIQASLPGKGPGSDGKGNVIFDPAQERGRSGLLLANGNIYTSWASFCDIAPFSGWIIAYNERTFAQTAVFNADPNGTPPSSDLPDGSGSGIWQAGSPPAVDADGNLYVSTGNGPFDTNLNAQGFPVSGDYGDTFLKLTPSLDVTSYFTPDNQLTLAINDGDFNSGGNLILDIADQSKVVHHLAITAGKDNNLYLLNRDNLGGFKPQSNNIYQELVGALPGGVWSSPAYFNGSIYYEPQGGALLQFQFASNATLDPVPMSASTNTFPYPGGTPSISSFGNTNGIVWVQENRDGQVVLHAYQATNLANQLYSSAGINFGMPTKFAPPTICNGKVFVGTMNSVGVFGLLQPTPTPTPATGSNLIPLSFLSSSGDFNADGKQDILWRDTQTGEVRFWYMNGSTILSNETVATVDLNWTVVGIGDFDGTGFSDILWKNANDGGFAIWTMRRDSAISHQFPSPGNQWSIAGVADLDHNGLADLLWRNVVTGEIRVWFSVSPLNFSSESLGNASPDWNLVGTADLFGNKLPELIWRNQNTGEVRAWQLNGNMIFANVSLGFAPLDWQIVGFGDFTGTGRQDILWRNTVDGSVDAWIMNGFTIAAQWFPTAVTLDWQIRATPDVNGNGLNSILWSNVNTGQQVIWKSTGSNFLSEAPFGVAAPPWVVQPQVIAGNVSP